MSGLKIQTPKPQTRRSMSVDMGSQKQQIKDLVVNRPKRSMSQTTLPTQLSKPPQKQYRVTVTNSGPQNLPQQPQIDQGKLHTPQQLLAPKIKESMPPKKMGPLNFSKGSLKKHQKSKTLRWATTAFNFTRRTMAIGAHNKGGNRVRTGNWSSVATGVARGKTFSWKPGKPVGRIDYDSNAPGFTLFPKRPDKILTPENGREDIKKLARLAEKSRGGNCQEQASVAYMHLINNTQGVKNAAFMSVHNHCFVLMNFDDNADMTDPNTWGDDAVICDPWGGMVCSVKQLMEQKGDCFVSGNSIPFDDSSVRGIQKYIMGQVGTLECHDKETLMDTPQERKLRDPILDILGVMV